MLIVFCFNYGNGNIGLVVKDIICPFSFFSARQVAFDIDATISKRDFFPNLGKGIPTCFFKSRLDIFCADVSF
jgi:hypothetical protein